MLDEPSLARAGPFSMMSCDTRALFVRGILAHIVRAASLAGRLAAMPGVWGVIAEYGLCPAQDDEHVWAYTVATSGRTLPPGLCHPAGGPVGCRVGVAAASADQ